MSNKEYSMDNIIPIRPIMYKTECQVCKNGYADENFMIGYCHGLELIEVPFTAEDYREHDTREEYFKELANKEINWE